MTDRRTQKITSVLNRRQPDLTVLMENVHKLHNLGAIARTCDAVGIGEIHAVTDASGISLTKSSASGSTRWVAIKTHQTIELAYAGLRAEGLRTNNYVNRAT